VAKGYRLKGSAVRKISDTIRKVDALSAAKDRPFRQYGPIGGGGGNAIPVVIRAVLDGSMMAQRVRYASTPPQELLCESYGKEFLAYAHPCRLASHYAAYVVRRHGESLIDDIPANAIVVWAREMQSRRGKVWVLDVPLLPVGTCLPQDIPHSACSFG